MKNIFAYLQLYIINKVLIVVLFLLSGVSFGKETQKDTSSIVVGFKISPQLSGNYKLVPGSALTLNGGFLVRKQLIKRLYIESGLLFLDKGLEVKGQQITATGIEDFSYSQHFYYIGVPVILGINVFHHFYLASGVVPAYFIAEKVPAFFGSSPNKRTFNIDFNLTMGGNIPVNETFKIFIEGTFLQQLLQFQQNSKNSGRYFNQGIAIGIIYKI